MAPYSAEAIVADVVNTRRIWRNEAIVPPRPNIAETGFTGSPQKHGVAQSKIVQKNIRNSKGMEMEEEI